MHLDPCTPRGGLLLHMAPSVGAILAHGNANAPWLEGNMAISDSGWEITSGLPDLNASGLTQVSHNHATSLF